MKATRKIGLWKAIAFLTVVILFSCTACDPDLNIKPQITLLGAENITATSATLVAYVVPNGETTVSFEYQTDNSAWASTTLSGKFDGSQEIRITFDVLDLKPGSVFNFKVIATNMAGSTMVVSVPFNTSSLPVSVVRLEEASEVTKNSAKLIAWVTPMQDVRVAYKVKGVTTKILPTIFSGSDSIKVTFDLSDLELNTKYEFYVETLNQDDKVITTSKSIFFKTYAVSDYDGNLYHTVTIGNQTWLQENFKGTHYANGDVIPNVQDSAQWANQKTGAYCYYKNDPEIGKVYGGLYNWYVASDSRGLIAGYYTPSESDWRNLIIYLNGDVAGRYLKETGTAHWQSPNYGSNNSTGFTGLPGGQRTAYRFSGITTVGAFWSSSMYPIVGLAYEFGLNEGVPNLNSGGNPYCAGASIRLIKK